jgi:transcriptional regulator with XRE-family HTH domain
MEITSKIDSVMEAKGFTLEQLLEKTSLPRMTLFNARRGKNVTIITAMKISEALETPINELWDSETIESEREDADISTGEELRKVS